MTRRVRGLMNAVVSSPKVFTSLSELKSNVHTMYPNSKVTKDAGSEFEMEGQSPAAKDEVARIP